MPQHLSRALVAVLLLGLVLAAGNSFVIGEVSQPAAGKLAARTGTVVTPRNFPRHNAADVTDMFRLDAELGSFAVIRVDWKDPEHFNAARAMVALADQHSLSSVLEFNPLKPDNLEGATLDPGQHTRGVRGPLSFANSAVAAAFTTAVMELVQTRPAYFAVATDVNLLALRDRESFNAFASLYRQLYQRIKEASPLTKVFVTFQWDAMQQAGSTAGQELIRAFQPQLDVLAFTSNPKQLFGSPGSMPDDYYTRIRQLPVDGREVLVEVTWPSEGRSGDAEQVAFIRSLPQRLNTLNPAMVAWTFLHDVRVLIFTVRAGLRNGDGSPKPAYAAFRDLSNDRPTLARREVRPPATAAAPSARTASTAPARFGVYTARLDGGGMEPVITDPDREMTHPRVSPDGKRLVLTRYHNRGRDGKATEEQGYENTEIVMMNLDGSAMETIIPPQRGVIAANGDWTPDGRSLIFISTDNSERRPEIRRIDLATRRIARVPTPSGLPATDPHWQGEDLVFPVKGNDVDVLWTMKADGSQARQVTRPARARRAGDAGNFGDFDPKLSPDRSKIAFMRIFGGTGWRVMVLDRATNQETDLTGDTDIIEGLPTWSGDGRLLLFRRIDIKKRPPEAKLYTMTPRGENRRPVPLPEGIIYNHATFLPGGGSGPDARIIFTATRVDR
jgi:Tol biopolymer transport system component